jgi:hypothetical protein
MRILLAAFAGILTWKGKGVPPELRELPAGRYVVEAVEEKAPELSPDEEERKHVSLLGRSFWRIQPEDSKLAGVADLENYSLYVPFRIRVDSINVKARMINPASSNSERSRSRPVLRSRYAPPDDQVGAIDDRLFENAAVEFGSHHIGASRRIVPEGQSPDVGIVTGLFPARPVRGASLEPSSVLTTTVNTIEIGLLAGAGVQQNVRPVSVHA